MFPFEKLNVWHDAMTFANSVYDAISEFPTEERFELSSQTRRSANSVAANLAEGACRRSSREKLRYIEQAYGSLMETVSHIYLAKMRRYIAPDRFKSLYGEAEQLGRRLSSYRDAIERRASDQHNA